MSNTTLLLSWDFLQLLSRSGGDGAGNLARAQGSDLVRQLGGGERAERSRVDGATERNILDNSISSLLGVGEENSTFSGVDKGRALDQDLGSHAGVDTGESHGIPEVVDDVDGGESNERLSAVDVLPVVVGISDAELASVLGGVAIRVSDQGALPLLENPWLATCLRDQYLIVDG